MDNEKRFNRILLATDGSEQAYAAVEATIELARFSSAVVRVAHVWSLDVHHRLGVWDVEVRAEAERMVSETVERLTAAGVMADKEIFRAGSGHVAGAIAMIARHFQADLVIVGSRGLSDWQSIFRHSVSHKVLSAVDCPVLVVRSRPSGDLASTRRILVAVAGGGDISPATRAAAAVARGRRCSVMVVHVAQAIVSAQGYGYVESEGEIDDALDRSIGELKDAGLEAEGMVAPPGPVAATVARIASMWNADLIVTGSSRMGDVASLLLGSVSHHLLCSTDIPVLIAERVKA